MLALAMLSAGCAKESRTLGPDQPQTPPNGPDDPRAAKYDGNVYQIGQGGRYFAWYGCGACHGLDAKGPVNLSGALWRHGRALDQVYDFIANRHPGNPRYGERIPTEQLWQITAYVRSLPDLPPERRRRQDMDQVGEPQGNTWSGPVR